MKRYSAADFGLLPDAPGCPPAELTDRSEALTKLIAGLPDGCELTFPDGLYYLKNAVAVIGKRDLTLSGSEGTVLLTHFSPWDDPKTDNDGFHFRDCENLTVTNFRWSTDHPTSCAGRVTAIDRDARTYDVLIDEEFPVTGWEHFWGTNTCDEDGMPDYVIATYDTITKETLPDENGKERVKFTGTKYEALGGNRIRVRMPEHFDPDRLTVGHRVLYRYLIYGNTVYGFSGCRNVTLSHIEIERCSSMGAVIQPRCADFTFEGFNIRSPKDSHALYAANADGVHVVGLEGFLHMKDCHFDGLGDDALNIHSQAGEVKSFDAEKGEMTCIYRRRDMTEAPLGPLWAQAGDRICVYDRNTFLRRGTVTLADYHGGNAKITAVEGSVREGDILANDSFFASVHLEDCSVRNTRARGFLLQSRNMLVERCTISGMALPGIIVSPDIRVWYEVGPSENVEIRNCVFEKCAMNGSAANLGAIVVKACHDVGADSYPAGVHNGMNIHDNVFRNCGGSGVFVSAAANVRVKDNEFSGCSSKLYAHAPDAAKYDIVLRNCSDVETSGNRTDKAPGLLEIRENC